MAAVATVTQVPRFSRRTSGGMIGPSAPANALPGPVIGEIGHHLAALRICPSSRLASLRRFPRGIRWLRAKGMGSKWYLSSCAYTGRAVSEENECRQATARRSERDSICSRLQPKTWSDPGLPRHVAPFSCDVHCAAAVAPRAHSQSGRETSGTHYGRGNNPKSKTVGCRCSLQL